MTTIFAEHGSSNGLGSPSTPIAPTEIVYILDAYPSAAQSSAFPPLPLAHTNTDPFPSRPLTYMQLMFC